jgi:hypothetical protein
LLVVVTGARTLLTKTSHLGSQDTPCWWWLLRAPHRNSADAWEVNEIVLCTKGESKKQIPKILFAGGGYYASSHTLVIDKETALFYRPNSGEMLENKIKLSCARKEKLESRFPTFYLRWDYHIRASLRKSVNLFLPATLAEI